MMARIIIKPTTVYHLCVNLTDDDIALILSSISQSNLTVARVAKLLGINRTYFYSALKTGQIEISRFLQLQSILSITLITDIDIKQACNLLAQTLISSLPHHATL